LDEDVDEWESVTLAESTRSRGRLRVANGQLLLDRGRGGLCPAEVITQDVQGEAGDGGMELAEGELATPDALEIALLEFFGEHWTDDVELVSTQC
jgi:hypothetical protein